MRVTILAVFLAIYAVDLATGAEQPTIAARLTNRTYLALPSALRVAYITGLSDAYASIYKSKWFVACTRGLSAVRIEEIFTKYLRQHSESQRYAASTSFLVAMDEFCHGPGA